MWVVGRRRSRAAARSPPSPRWSARRYGPSGPRRPERQQLLLLLTVVAVLASASSVALRVAPRRRLRAGPGHRRRRGAALPAPRHRGGAEADAALRPAHPAGRARRRRPDHGAGPAGAGRSASPGRRLGSGGRAGLPGLRPAPAARRPGGAGRGRRSAGSGRPRRSRPRDRQRPTGARDARGGRPGDRGVVRRRGGRRTAGGSRSTARGWARPSTSRCGTTGWTSGCSGSGSRRGEPRVTERDPGWWRRWRRTSRWWSPPSG